MAVSIQPVMVPHYFHDGLVDPAILALTEPDCGTDLQAIRCVAKRDGDDYVINGAKIWTSLGHAAKYMILLARTDPSPAPGRSCAA